MFKDLFGEQEGVLSESTQKTILEAFNSKVDEVVEERVQLATEEIDKRHTGMLQQLVEKHEEKLKSELRTLEESIDEDHTNKVKEVFSKLEEDRTRKMEQVVEHYENLLSEEVSKECDVLVESVDKFLDNWLDEKVPTKFIKEAAKKDYSQSLLKKISNLVGINESVDNDVREGLKDAKLLIDKQQKVIDNLRKENFLKEKTAKLPISERNQILESFADYDYEFTKRNFEFQKRQILKESEKSNFDKDRFSKNVDRDRGQDLINESTAPSLDKEEGPHPALAVWANTLNDGFGITP